MSTKNSINLEEQLILKVAVNAFKYNTINDHIVAKNDVAKIDWDKFITLAIDQSLTFICYKTLNSILPEQYLNKLRLIYTFNSKKVNNDVAICDCLFRLAKTNGFHPVLGKGFRLSKLIYNDIYIRQYDDIDIYCRLGYSVILKEMHGEGGDSAAVHCAVRASRNGNMGAPKESRKAG